MHLGGVVGVSSVYRALLCRSVSPSPAESYVYFISPGCLFVLRCAAPPLAVSLLLVSCGKHQSYSPPLLSLCWLTATLCFSLCFSWSACLPPEGSSLFSLSAAEGSRIERIQTGSACQENSFCLSLSLSAFDFACFFAFSFLLLCHFWEKDTSSPSAASPSMLSFYSRSLSSVTAAKNGCTSDGLHQQLIAIFAPSVSLLCFD